MPRFIRNTGESNATLFDPTRILARDNDHLRSM